MEWRLKEINYLRENYLKPISDLHIEGRSKQDIQNAMNRYGFKKYCVLPTTVNVSNIKEDYKTMSAREVGKKYKIHQNTVYNLVGFRKKTNKKWNDEELQKAIEMKQSGLTAGQIANNLGRTTASIYEKLKPSKL